MTFETLDLLSHTSILLAAATDYAAAEGSKLPERGEMFWLLSWLITLGLGTICLGIVVCLIALVRGPELADRVLAADLLAFHVVGLVLLLTIYMGDLDFFDAALVVAIIGFVSTVGFAQYIYAQAGKPDESDPDLGESDPSAAAETGATP
jgi:multicomponent K+:H+ antiporter subunit F